MVDVSNKHKSITVKVSSKNGNTVVAASSDTSQYWANRSHTFANQSKESAQDSKHYAELANSYIEGFEDVVTNNTNNIIATSNDCINQIAENTGAAIDSINNTKTTILNDIEFVADGEKQEIEELIDNGKEELKESIGDVKVLTTLEIGDIGFTQMAIDESKGKRRILNGQLIIQDQYLQLTNIIKNSVALNPGLACTEAEWQTELTMSANGVCYKYVIDDEAGTIRLPKYPDYLDLSINGAKTVSVYGTGMALGLTDGSNLSGLVKAGNYLGDRFGAYGKSVGQTITGSGISGEKVEGITSDPTKSGITGSVTTSSEQIKGTYFIQVATGAETEDNIINEIELNNPFFLGMSQYFETAPNNLSWLKSEGQWNAKATYPTVYDWALINANNSIEGFKLVTDTYTDYDYVINTAEETFRLPLLNGSEDLTGNKVDNLTLEASGTTYTAPANGWFYISKNCSSGQNLKVFLLDENYNLLSCTYEVASANGFITISTEISKGYNYQIFYNASGATNEFRFIYAQGNGSLYYYVGETVQNANLVNIGRIQEQYTTKSMVDGQWISFPEIIEVGSPKSLGVYTFDISNYLPNDGYIYDVFLECGGKLSKGGTGTIAMNVSSSVIPHNCKIAQMNGDDSANQFDGVAISLPIGTDRVLTVELAGSSGVTLTESYVYLYAYRRLGTNL